MAVKPLQSLQRALLVVEAVAEHQPIGVGALCRLLDEDKSALQRVLVTLHASGWIRPTGDGATRWELSTRPLVIVGAAQRRSGLVARARPVMTSLREATGETVILAVPDAGRIVALEVVESRHLVRTAPHVGMVLPPETGAAGLAVFAHLDDAGIAAYLGTKPDGTFSADLADTRRRGWSLNPGVVHTGATSIGAAVLDAAGRPVAAVVVSAPSDRLPPDRYPVTGGLVREAAAALGHAVTHPAA
jgi:IclR family transcriptional regulator, acetate operon repressor